MSADTLNQMCENFNLRTRNAYRAETARMKRRNDRNRRKLFFVLFTRSRKNETMYTQERVLHDLEMAWISFRARLRIARSRGRVVAPATRYGWTTTGGSSAQEEEL